MPEIPIEKFDAFAHFLNEAGIPFERNFSIKEYTSFRIGGTAEIFARPKNAQQAAVLQKSIFTDRIPHYYLGGGSNILVSDNPYAGVVIYYDAGEDFLILEQSADFLRVSIPASARAPLAGKRISALGYTGMEFLTTIPGYIGGAVIQNAGCYGQELCDITESVEFCLNGEVITIPKEEADFSYRSSRFKTETESLITSLTVRLSRGDESQIRSRIEDYKQRRLNSQPRNRRSAGSVFKNPHSSVSEKKAWQLIDQCGLRGTVAGDAEISSEHCNFIVNRGKATSQDVYSLICLIEETVYSQTGIRLEREVVLLGDF